MHYDLVIIGGGLVGAGLALALRHTKLRIALIDAKQPSNTDPRLFALNHTSCQFLKNIDCWDALAKEATAIHEVHVSNQGHFGAVRLNRADAGLPALGFVIPAFIIETVLNEALNQASNVTLYRPATLTSLIEVNDHVNATIQTAQGEIKVSASVLIGADGTESTVRNLMHIATDRLDYKQSALVMRTTLQRSHHHIAYERFTKHGTIAMLPLPNVECATIWSADTDTINTLRDLPDATFLQRLQAEFGYRLGRIIRTSTRYVFPLHMVRAEKAVVGRVLLIGNALHSLHPIAAQGFNLALFEVAVLVDAIKHHPADDSLSRLNLIAINERIQAQLAKSAGISHRLSQLFKSDAALPAPLIQLGMLGLDLTSPIKRKFIEGIMGRTGHVPSLLMDGIET